ncbi:MBOAT family O-acyltransferase [Fluviicola sp.]|jgi:D-alanyl-lipoteichoic acid acyltransferase DltB (MBOAT superfamily)|uniref:MBOAT family O-acyltransferase n=1 Tax=Fluviicola sp. TaxID=1917219 RepID=UPI00283456F2|nr:MBOAT family O-acyltransferase [Fluviicola sp.]MDR0802285.1 MBOAT family protein [Fluviicola sp.]
MESLHRIFSFTHMSADDLAFNRLDFWIFFLAFMVLFSFLHKNQLVRSMFITIMSLFLYFKTSGFFVTLLALSVTVNFLLGKWIFRVKSSAGRKWIITFSAIFNLFFLGFFKYAHFFTDSFNKMFHTDYEIFNTFAQWGNGFFGDGTFETTILLPAGVSFFTFQSISYVVDIYRKEIKPVKNYWDYAFYVTYFPHVLMGPIVRARDFIPQIYQKFHLTKKEFGESVFLIMKGLFKKIVLADFIATHFINSVVDNPGNYPGYWSVIAMWGYSLQIYGDFSGYTDIAIGISKLMGFELLPNFNSPYKANSVADFWRRWHKSLGSWLKDYLYIPLGGNKKGTAGTYIAIIVIFIFLIFITGWYELIFVYAGLMSLYGIAILISPKAKTFMHRDLNLLITMILGGLWHGASQNFVIWGAMNGLALVIYNHWKKISPYEKSSRWIVHFWKILITFNFITFTRIWFRLKTEGAPNNMLDRIFNHFNFQWDTFQALTNTYYPVLLIMLLGFFIHWMPQKWKNFMVSYFVKTPMILQMAIIAVFIVILYQAASDSFQPFVYLEF